MAIEGLDTLPDSAVMEMHIEFTPDAPEDYNAPGYVTTNEVVKIAGGDNQVFRKTFNKLPTPHHKVLHPLQPFYFSVHNVQCTACCYDTADHFFRCN